MRAKIRNLGMGGMVSDLPHYDISPAHVTRAVNVEFRDGAITRAWGFTPEHAIPGNAVWMESWFSAGNGRSLVVTETTVGSGEEAQNVTQIHEIANGVVGDITPEDSAITWGRSWDSTVFGNSAILVHEGAIPYARTIASSGPLEHMANWPSGWRTPMIRTYRNFLVALRVAREGVADDTRLQWSNASPNNGLPPDWDPLDPASLAGGTSLAGQNGPIQDAATLGQSLIIYMQTATYAMALGGASVMSIRPLFNLGILDRGCVIPFDTFHFCIGNGVIYTHDGSSVQYPAENVVQSQFFEEMVDPASIHLGNDVGRKVVEIFYKTDTSLSHPNRVLRWNYQTNTWTFNDLDGYGIVRALYAPDSQRLTTWEQVDTEIGGGNVVAWSDADLSWRSLDVVAGRLSLKLLMRSDSGSFVMKREALYLRNGSPFESVVEREGIDFDEILEGADPLSIQSVKHMKRVVPQVLGQGTVFFQFGTAMTPAGGTTWGPIIPYNIQTDYKVDFRSSGRYFAWRLYSAVDEPALFRLSGFDLDVEVAGER
jgi:hypothetical protein